MVIKCCLTTISIISLYSLFFFMDNPADLKVYSILTSLEVQTNSENQQINQQNESVIGPLNSANNSSTTINQIPLSNSNMDNLSNRYQSGVAYTGSSSYKSNDVSQSNEFNTNKINNEKTNNIPANLEIPANWGSPGIPSYKPEKVNINKGDKLLVTNKDINYHTVTNTGSALTELGKLFDSSLISAQDIKIVDTSKLKPGEYPFSCRLHPSMKGTLIVR